MGLIGFQKALARLYTDEGFIDSAQNNPGDALSHYDLTPLETDQIIQMIKRDFRIHEFQRSLIAKRRLQVEKCLPTICGLLGKDFQPLFHKFASANRFTGVEKYRADTIEFGKYALEHISLDQRYPAQFELDTFIAVVYPKLLRIRIYPSETKKLSALLVIWLKLPWRSDVVWYRRKMGF